MTHFLPHRESGSPFYPAGVTESDIDGKSDPDNFICAACDMWHWDDVNPECLKFSTSQEGYGVTIYFCCECGVMHEEEHYFFDLHRVHAYE